MRIHSYFALLALSFSVYAKPSAKDSSYEDFSSLSKTLFYEMASFCTDPVCKAREYIVRVQAIHDIEPSPSLQQAFQPYCHFLGLDPKDTAVFLETYFLVSGISFFSAAIPFTLPPYFLLRFAAYQLENQGFTHLYGNSPERDIKGSTFTHMHWNICGIKGGYDIEEGAQVPIQDDFISKKERRIHKIAEKIKQESPDVLCLNEVFDIADALYLAKQLKEDYAHFIIQCGTPFFGVNSGLFFATKFSIKNPVFHPFSKDVYVDVERHAQKGFLCVEIEDCKGLIGLISLTHLQHSSQPEYPTLDEKMLRKRQLQEIALVASGYESIPFIFSGDLNLDDAEFEEIFPSFYHQFFKVVEYDDISVNQESKTWLGDQWYIEYGNRDSTVSIIPAWDMRYKRIVSQGVNLDHTLLKTPHQNGHISTRLLSTGYDPTVFSRDSLSDHMILLSEISLER